MFGKWLSDSKVSKCSLNVTTYPMEGETLAGCTVVCKLAYFRSTVGRQLSGVFRLSR